MAQRNTKHAYGGRAHSPRVTSGGPQIEEREPTPSQVESDALPKIGYVRLRDVLRVYPVGKSTWWAGVRSGRYPAPVKLLDRVTAWRVSDIRALLREQGGE